MTLLQLTPALATHRGMRRRNNEDSVGYHYPNEPSILREAGAIFIVADGVGGLAGGEKASKMAVEVVTKHYYERTGDFSLAERLIAAVKRANQDVYQQFDSKAATTLVAVVIQNDQLIATSIGDSLLFLIHDGRIEQLNEEDVQPMGTHDPGKGSVLTKAVGHRVELEVETIHHRIAAGDRVLLCSDGLTRYLDETQLSKLATLRDPRDGVRRMIHEANQAGGADNISAVIIAVGEATPLESLPDHINRLNVRVAVAQEPMFTPDVSTKPNTQIPLAPREIDPTPPEEASTPGPIPIEAQSLPQAPSQTAGRNRLLLVGIGVLVLAALIIGSAIGLLGSEGSNAGGNAAAPGNGQMTVNDVNGPIRVGDVVELSESVVTQVRVGLSDQSVASFVTVPAAPYIIQDIFEDDEGLLWYRLLEEESSQTGWLAASELPAYQVISDN